MQKRNQAQKEMHWLEIIFLSNVAVVIFQNILVKVKHLKCNVTEEGCSCL